MIKRLICLALSMALFLCMLTQHITAFEDLEPITPITEEPGSEELTAPAVEEESAPAVEEEPAPTGPVIFVNDVAVEGAAPFYCGWTTYVSIRAVAQALRPDADIYWADDGACVTAEGLSITAKPDDTYIQANGRYLYVPDGVKMVNYSVMVPIRVIATALDAQLHWEAETGNVYLTGGSGAIASADEFYDEDSLYWLSHIINAESGNQPLNGKIAVGNVVLNRLNNPTFPDTIHGVIYQKNQFSPARSGSIKKTPNAESVIAAKLCLEGVAVLPTALWFNRNGLSSWAARNKECIAVIGDHSFFA